MTNYIQHGSKKEHTQKEIQYDDNDDYDDGDYYYINNINNNISLSLTF